MSQQPRPPQYRSPTMRDLQHAATRERLRVQESSKRHEGEGAIGSTRLRHLRLVSQNNDYLTCKQVSGGETTGPDILVAKPYKLRHVLANYEGLTALTTVSAGKVTAEDASGEETWVVVPSYQADDDIYAAAVVATGVTVSEAELRLIDANLDGRAWAEEASS